METKRGSFTGGLGFIFAAAGSAIGLGNLWRFPYLAAQYGGGIFILVYIILALTFGFTLMITEIAIGRKTGTSPILAYEKLDKRFGFIGYIAAAIPVIIFPYYCVIGGWVVKYMFLYLTGDHMQAAEDGYFASFIGSTASPLIFFGIFLLLNVCIVVAGVDGGIEKVSKILMPILLVLMVGVCIYVCFIPGTWEGIKYYLTPDFSKFSFKTVCGAMGQMFYSMSLAMGIMITYGSYMKKDVSIPKSVGRIEFFDTLVAILAGFMIIPVLYAFSGEEGLNASGPGLMFVSLPKVFDGMAGGRILGFVFFALVLFAALTSAVSVMEAVVSCMSDKFGITRKKASFITVIIAILLGVPSSMGNGAWSSIKLLGMDFLSFFDYLSNSVLMPIVAFLTCILIGWIVGIKPVEEEVTLNQTEFPRKKMYQVMIKYIAPVLLLIILVVYTLAQFGIISL